MWMWMKGVLVVALMIGLTFGFVLTEKEIQNNWAEVDVQLNVVQSLQIGSHQLSESSLLKVLSHSMPRLTDLRFVPPQTLTARLVKVLFTSSYFPRLKVLFLNGTNIDHRALSFLDESNLQINSSLINLTLNDLLLGRKGFERLSRIAFNGSLQTLEVFGNNLIEESAVDGVLRMICRYQNQTCYSRLQGLSIGSTMISRDGFIKLMDAINSSSLVRLDMSENLIHTNLKVKEGFNFTAYEYLAGIKFPKLVELKLNGCGINEKIAQILSKWSTPALSKLFLGPNPLGDKGLKWLVSRERTPNLIELMIEGTLISDVSMEYIKNQGYSLSGFKFGDNRITGRGLQCLLGMNLTGLSELVLRKFDVEESVVVRVLNSISVPSLGVLILYEMVELRNILNLLKWQNFPSLDKFVVQKASLEDSFLQFTRGRELKCEFKSNLTKFSLEDAGLDQQSFSSVMLSLPLMFPLLSYVRITESSKLIGVGLPKLLGAGYGVGCELNFDVYSVVMNETRMSVSRLHSFVRLSFDFFNDSSMVGEGRFFQFAGELVKIMEFDHLSELTLNSVAELYLLKMVMDAGQIKELSGLNRFRWNFQVNVEEVFGLFRATAFPHLFQGIFKFIVPGDADSALIEGGLIAFLRHFQLMKQLVLIFQFLNEDNGPIWKQRLMDSLNYPYLQHFEAPFQQLSASDLKALMERHRYGLRILNFHSSFLEKGFIDLLVDNQIVPTVLWFGFTSFTVNQFAKLGSVVTQFLVNLDLQANGLVEDHMLALVQAKNGSLLFPRLSILNMANNNIRQIGLQVLLQTGMPLLELVVMQFNSGAGFLNLQFRYTNMIKNVIANNVEVYSLDEDMNPDSVSEIIYLNLKTYSFSESDFKVLGGLHFINLHESVIFLGNIYSCQSLGELLKINQWTNNVVYSFKNDEQGLTSACLRNVSDYSSRVRQLYIIDEFGTTFLPEFVTLTLATNQNIKILRLIKTRLSSESFKSIFKHRFDKIEILDLQFNYLDDQGFKLFLSSDLSQLLQLNLKSTLITANVIEELSNLSISNLQVLDLSQNNLGDSVVALFPVLCGSVMELHLSGCGLSVKSLRQLNQYIFSQLQVLVLNYNRFSESDVIEFVSDLSRMKWNNLRSISMRGVTFSRSGYETVKKILKRKYIGEYELDVPFAVQAANSAAY